MDANPPNLPLEPAVFSNDVEPGSCACDGECCHEHSILLTHHDVCRILEVQSIDPRELLIFFEAHAGYVDLDVLGGYPALMLDGGPCYMGLRFVADEDHTRKHCRFLDHATNRCTIHVFKPMVCRTYPFIIDNGKITRHEKLRCKRPYHPNQTAQIAALQRILHDAYREFEEYKDKVARWNESTRDAAFEAFFKHFFKF